MTTIVDLLRDAADDAPAGGPLPGLYDRAVRRRRRGRVARAATVLAVVLTVAGISVLSWQAGRVDVRPAGSDSRPAIPDRIYTPSGWLDGTEDAGLLGAVAAVLPAERNTWSGHEAGLAGVSASTGEYRFLDLSAYVTGGTVSPDGRYVAYWAAGETRDGPVDNHDDLRR